MSHDTTRAYVTAATSLDSSPRRSARHRLTSDDTEETVDKSDGVVVVFVLPYYTHHRLVQSVDTLS